MPVAPLLNSSVKRCRRAGIPAMAARLAPKVRVPATIGRRCAADMVGRRDERVDRRDLVEENTNQGGKASIVYAIDEVSAKRVESLVVSCRHAWLAQRSTRLITQNI